MLVFDSVPSLGLLNVVVRCRQQLYARIDTKREQLLNCIRAKYKVSSVSWPSLTINQPLSTQSQQPHHTKQYPIHHLTPLQTDSNSTPTQQQCVPLS
jgi:hypothetical protein